MSASTDGMGYVILTSPLVYQSPSPFFLSFAINYLVTKKKGFGKKKKWATEMILDSFLFIFSLSSTADKDGTVPVSRTLSGHRGYVSCCQYVPNEDAHLITSSGDQTCVLWDVTTGLKTSVFGGEFQSGHTGDVLRYGSVY